MTALEKLIELYPTQMKISEEAFTRYKSRKIRSVRHVVCCVERTAGVEAYNKMFPGKERSEKEKELLDSGILVKKEHVTWLEPSVIVKDLREEEKQVGSEMKKKWKAEKDPIFQELRTELEDKYPISSKWTDPSDRSTTLDVKWKATRRLANGFPDIERVYAILSE